MYLVSEQLAAVDRMKMEDIEQQIGFQLPSAYREFLEQYGPGTYCGLLNVELPDAEQLKEFAEHDLWEEHENGPIRIQQIIECIVIATTVDGDFLALHPQVSHGIWLPRHSQFIESVDLTGSSWQEVMDRILSAQYGAAESYTLLQQKPYFEPGHGKQQYDFLRLHVKEDPAVAAASAETQTGFPPEAERQHDEYNNESQPLNQHQLQMQMALKQAANTLGQLVTPDLRIETEYSGLMFYRSMGGYVRFNYAYGSEVALLYTEEDRVHWQDRGEAREASMREILRDLDIY